MTEPASPRGGGATARLEARIVELEQRLEELERGQTRSAQSRQMLRRMVPPEATTHFRAAAREQLRGISVLLEHWVRGLEARDVEQARSNSGPERIVIE